MRNFTKFLKCAVSGTALLLGSKASAIPIYLNPPGQVAGNPANPVAELNRLNNAITAYDLATPASLPAALAIDLSPLGIDKTASGGQSLTPSSPTSITLDFSVEKETYLMLKWGDIDEFFFVGNETGLYTFYSDVHPINPHTHKPNLNSTLGLSHYDLFDAKDAVTAVPEGGSSLLLLGLGLTGISLVAHWIRKT